MTMTEERAKRDEISETFIITKKYGTQGAYPPKTLIFCKANFASSESISKESSDSSDASDSTDPSNNSDENLQEDDSSSVDPSDLTKPMQKMSVKEVGDSSDASDSTDPSNNSDENVQDDDSSSVVPSDLTKSMHKMSVKEAGESSDASDSTDPSNNSDEEVQGGGEFKGVFRNNKDGHAESRCLQQLKLKGSEANKIDVELIQSYAPCHECADKMIEYKKEMEDKGKEVSIKVKFANYYYWFGEDDKGERGRNNLKGLKKMGEKGIVLQLIQGEDSWETLFGDHELVDLTEADKEQLRKKAYSDERKERENADRKLCEEKKLF